MGPQTPDGRSQQHVGYNVKFEFAEFPFGKCGKGASSTEARLSAVPPLDCCHGLMRPATRPAYAASCSMRTSCCTALARGDASTPSSVRLRVHRDNSRDGNCRFHA